MIVRVKVSGRRSCYMCEESAASVVSFFYI